MPYLATVGEVPEYMGAKVRPGQRIVLEYDTAAEGFYVPGTSVLVDKEVMEAADPPWEFTWIKNDDPLTIAMTKLMQKVKGDSEYEEGESLNAES